MLLKGKKLLFITRHKEYCEYDIAQGKKQVITIQEYCKQIFGKYNHKLEAILNYSFEIGKNQIFAASFQTPTLFIFDLDGNLIETKKNFFDAFTPYGIALSEDQNSIWAATGACQIVINKQIQSEEIDYIIGTPYDDVNSVLSFPEDVAIHENKLFITEMGNRQILSVDLDNSTNHEIYLKFKESVWSFLKNEFVEIVILDSGIYKVENGNLVKLPI